MTSQGSATSPNKAMQKDDRFEAAAERQGVRPNILTVDLPVEVRVWNRAALESGGAAPREGDRALAALLLAHGLVMNGGVHHALELLSPDEIRAAISGFEFFFLAPVGRLLEVAQSLEEEAANRQYRAIIPNDDAIDRRLRVVFGSSPHAFAPLDG